MAGLEALPTGSAVAELDLMIGPELRFDPVTEVIMLDRPNLEHYCALVWIRERLRKRINGRG